MDNRRLFIRAAILVTLVKLFLSWIVPITGDEAYFMVWGDQFELGYYDHTPMVGWLIWLFSLVSQNLFFIRLIPNIASLIILWLILRIALKLQREKAYTIGLIFLLSPIHLFNVLITTDTPLLLFSMLSIYYFYIAETEQRISSCLLAGISLGLAFFSKYFAVLLGLTYLIYFLLGQKNGKRIGGYLLLFLGVIPFALINIYWNYHHAWVNLVFNMVNRNAGMALNIKQPLLLLACLVYLCPPLLYFLVAGLRQRPSLGPVKPFVYLFCIPLGIFFVISFTRSIGLHWILSFYYCLYLIAIPILTEAKLRQAMKFMSWYAGFHALLVFVLLVLLILLKTLPNLDLISGKLREKNVKTVITVAVPEGFANEIKRWNDGNFVLAAESYSYASLLQYLCSQHVVVYGLGSYHARQDDLRTDFKQLEGRNFMIISREDYEEKRYRAIFARVEPQSFTLKGKTFTLIKGYGFSYAAYRDAYLKPIHDTFYLPALNKLKLPGRDFFAEKYGL